MKSIRAAFHPRAASAIEGARGTAHGGQVLLTKATRDLVEGRGLRDRFGSGVVFVPLSAVTDPGWCWTASPEPWAPALGGGSPLQALAELFGDDPWILILDNLEQVASAAGDLAELLGRCRGVAILATSRTVLGLAAEPEYPVPRHAPGSRNCFPPPPSTA